MRTRNYFAAFAMLAALALPTGAHADQFLADFRGFDYEDPNNTPGFGSIGDGYNSLGLVLSVNPALLTIDNVNNEYTYRFYNLAAVGSEIRCAVPLRVLLAGRLRHLRRLARAGHGGRPTAPTPRTPPRRRPSSTARTSSAGPSPTSS